MQKKNRILKNEDFIRIIKKGKIVKSENASFFYLKNSFNYPRVGITVSKKVSKLAIIRNKVKRRIRFIMMTKLNMELPIDLVIIAKNNIKNITYKNLSCEIEKSLRRINEIWQK